ncbi:hypothetical protein WICMUC_000134 [Wickerhamomyces mucosus]|uniref:Transmembrane protein n=1 Tax=Wickerhamomyces mucosus TaxID=1378264 RepID=A0A9P8PYQ6_9ASCO|nr:hypothetical protein WICMUC_000134 [Wickerhamomyces mucosus]
MLVLGFLSNVVKSCKSLGSWVSSQQAFKIDFKRGVSSLEVDNFLTLSSSPSVSVDSSWSMVLALTLAVGASGAVVVVVNKLEISDCPEETGTGPAASFDPVSDDDGSSK